MNILPDDNYQHLMDHPINLRCPHCDTLTALIPISIPRFALIRRFRLGETGIVYRCSSCNKPVFLKFKVYAHGDTEILSENFEMVSTSLEPFEMKYLKGEVKSDFQESLICYANSCWNAFAAMSRRCVQSISDSFDSNGSNKVEKQLKELKTLGMVDDQVYKQLHTIMLSGHDGAHPHLPKLDSDRAAILLQVMKDVLHQLFVRPAKIEEANELRKAAIDSKKEKEKKQ